MEFCDSHWTALRAAIDKRGLSALVADSGEKAASNMVRELQEGRPTIDTFDPLMSAHNAILANAMRILGGSGMNALYLLASGEEDPIEGYGPEYAGRTWPRCPLCYLGLAHEVSCADHGCRLPKVNGYDWMIDRAADEAAETWKALQP